MKYFLFSLFSLFALMGTVFLISSCDKDDDTVCTESTWYQDADGDGLGNPDVSFDSCEQPTGYVANAADDDDVCSGVVDACGVCDGPGETTWYEDADGDGLGNPDVSQEACDQPDGYVADNSDTNDVPDETSYSFTYNGENYKVVREASSWLDAVSYAVADGGYLAEINSEEEQTAIFVELVNNAEINFDETNNQFGFAAVWLGGNDLETEGVWVWNGNNDDIEVQFWEGGVDGMAVNGLYNNWGNEPDNNGDQDALCIGLETTPINAAGKWTDLDGTDNNLFFLIEYD